MDRFLSHTKDLYNNLGWKISDFKVENESAKYEACSFKLNNMQIISRKSRITPNKIGSFVTFWKRQNNGPIMPYDAIDNFEFLVINISSKGNIGQFIFPKSSLLEQNVISKSSKGGKRAIRVYAPWDSPTSKQAVNTQKWQVKYFFDMSLEKEQKLQQTKKLYRDYTK